MNLATWCCCTLQYRCIRLSLSSTYLIYLESKYRERPISLGNTTLSRRYTDTDSQDGGFDVSDINGMIDPPLRVFSHAAFRILDLLHPVCFDADSLTALINRISRPHHHIMVCYLHYHLQSRTNRPQHLYIPYPRIFTVPVLEIIQTRTLVLL